MKGKKKSIVPAASIDFEEDLETEESVFSEEASEEASEDISEGMEERQVKKLVQADFLPLETALDFPVRLPVYSPVKYQQDPLRSYLNEITRYSLLDPEKELELVRKLRESGDVDTAKALVTANLRLVVKIAFEYKSVYTNMLDLIQEGNVGLMKAVLKFDPSKGARLSYYASWWIRSYILKYLLDNFRLVKVGTTLAQKRLYYHLVREKGKLEAQGILAGPKLLADKLNVKEKDVLEMQQRLSISGAEVSLDATLDRGSQGTSLTPKDFLEDHAESIEDILMAQQLVVVLRKKLPEFEKTLSEKEMILLKDRLLAEEPRTLQDVADLYGLTRERVRQIEVKLLLKLRKLLSG